MGKRLCLLSGRWIEDAPKRKKPEASVARSVDNFLRLKGFYMRSIKSDGTKTADGWRRSSQGAGISDRIGITPDGRFVAIELKALGKRRNVTDAQISFLINIAKRGGIACVADSVECVITALNQTKEEMLSTLQSLIKQPKHSPSSKEPLFP